ncbi:hypothetical protein C1646_814475 [Rhizophagus diaphanus]|nr:hypothetical protein C1646_814475 [Rhizophagus diaphanus] [Rhizophagus sp. MUCL 43196]
MSKKLRLQQLTSYFEFNRNSPNFGSWENLIVQLKFNPEDFMLFFDISRKDNWQYNAIYEFANPPDELLREWGIYCGLESRIPDIHYPETILLYNDIIS